MQYAQCSQEAPRRILAACFSVKFCAVNVAPRTISVIEDDAWGMAETVICDVHKVALDCVPYAYNSAEMSSTSGKTLDLPMIHERRTSGRKLLLQRRQQRPRRATS